MSDQQGSWVDEVVVDGGAVARRSALERAAALTVETSAGLRRVYDEVLDRNRCLLDDLSSTLDRVQELLRRL